MLDDIGCELAVFGNGDGSLADVSIIHAFSSEFAAAVNESTYHPIDRTTRVLVLFRVALSEMNGGWLWLCVVLELRWEHMTER